MERATEIIVKILAVTDAIFRPLDSFENHAGATVYHRRRAFFNGGVPASVALGASSIATKKTAQRQLAELKVEGLVTVANPSGARTLSVRLTPDGDAEARAICGLPDMADALTLLDELYRLKDDPSKCVSSSGMTKGDMTLIPETKLGRIDYREPGGMLALKSVLEERMAPLLCAGSEGLAESRTTGGRHTWYGLTPEGVALAEQRKDVGIDVIPPLLGRFDQKAHDLYRVIFRAEEQAIVAANTRGPEIGLMPLSGGSLNGRR